MYFVSVHHSLTLLSLCMSTHAQILNRIFGSLSCGSSLFSEQLPPILHNKSSNVKIKFCIFNRLLYLIANMWYFSLYDICDSDIRQLVFWLFDHVLAKLYNNYILHYTYLLYYFNQILLKSFYKSRHLQIIFKWYIKHIKY